MSVYEQISQAWRDLTDAKYFPPICRCGSTQALQGWYGSGDTEWTCSNGHSLRGTPHERL